MYNKITKQQKGVATLTVSVSVALLMAVAAVGMMRSGMLEQKIAANDLRAREAQEIAEAGMEYAIASGLAPSNQCPSDLNLIDNKFNFTSNENRNILNQIIAVQTAEESYSPSIGWCYKELNGGKIYFVRSQAEIPSSEVSRDPVVKAFVESWFIKKKDSFLNDVDVFPPFFVKGDFCPEVVKNNRPSPSCNGNASIGDLGAYNQDYGKWVIASGVANVGSLHQKNSQSNKPASAPSSVIESNREINSSAWEYAFNVTLAKAKALALENQGEPFYYFGDNNVNSGSAKKNQLGSKANPIILIIEKKSNGDCPNVQLDVYGVIYMSGPCDVNGWGSGKVYGSIVSDGNITGLNANTIFYKFDDALWSGLIGSAGFVIPGTWRDFEIKP